MLERIAYDNIISGILEGEENPFVLQKEPWAVQYSEEAYDFWKYAAETSHYEELLGKVRNFEYRNYIAMNTDGREIEYRPTVNGIARYMGSVNMGYLENDFFRIRNLDIRGDVLHLEGAVGFYGIPEGMEVVVHVEDNRSFHLAHCTDRNHERPHGISMRVVAFRCDVPLSGSKEHVLGIRVRVGRLEPKVRVFTYDRMSPIDCKIKNQYLVRGNWYVTAEQSRIKVCALPGFGRKRFIRNLEKEYLEEIKYNNVDKYQEVMKFRSEAAKIKARSRKPIVLFSDRIMSAGDNCEALFKYAANRKEIDAYFVIDGSADDYSRMKQYGQVLDQKSDECRLMTLAASAIVGSQSSEVFRNPFGDDGVFYRDLLHKPFIISEHGISHGKDLHSWFCRSNRMIDMLMVGGQLEYEQFTLPEYGFAEDEVAVTGLPRFDYLVDASSKIITVMPTWRSYLTTGQDVTTGLWKVRDDFEESTYAVFNRQLMEDARLNRAAREAGYRLQFVVHPCLKGEPNVFGFSPDVDVASDDTTYTDIFAESSLIVTDYSSIAYDFAYLKKPIIYTQYDADEMNAGHTFETGHGYTYEEFGFGEIETTIDGTVDRIIEYMNSDCSMKPQYAARVDEFFGTVDKKNCERCYAEILRVMAKFG